jgi:hypothetical protein
MGEIYEIIRAEALKDKRLRRKWEVEKTIRMQTQKDCKYCGMKFGGSVKAVLHHVQMEGKIESGMSVKELIEYYKSLKDTVLICNSCHAGEHLFDAKEFQRKLKPWIK